MDRRAFLSGVAASALAAVVPVPTKRIVMLYGIDWGRDPVSYAYFVGSKMHLADFGNRIPDFEVVVECA